MPLPRKEPPSALSNSIGQGETLPMNGKEYAFSNESAQSGSSEQSQGPLLHLFPPLAHAPWPMVRLEGERHIVQFSNLLFCRLVSKSVEELTGNPLASVIPGNHELFDHLDRVYRTGLPENFLEQDRREDNGGIWASTMWPVMTNNRPVGVMLQVTETAPDHLVDLNEALAIGLVRQHELTEAAETLNAQLSAEIAERKLAEAAVRRSEAKFQASETYFRELTQSLPCGMWTRTPDGRVDFVNRYWLAYTGHTLEDATDHPAIWADILHPDDKARVEQLTLADRAVGQGYTFEARIRQASSGEYRWFLKRSVAVLDCQGNLQKRIGISIDIEELKRAQNFLRDHARELESLVDARTAELREMVGELEAFSYSVSHDLRGPLTILMGYADLLLEKHASTIDAESLVYLTKINSAAARLKSLICDVLACSRSVRSQMCLQPVSLDQLLREVIVTYPQLSVKGAVIAIEGTLPTVMADPASLTQCISNILSNAVKFVTPGTTARVRVYTEELEGDIRLWIEDNGIGIAPTDHERIWEIFNRLPSSNDYDGTGIGLAIVRKAVERMKGTVGLESAVGKGSRFWLKLRKGPLEPQ